MQRGGGSRDLDLDPLFFFFFITGDIFIRTKQFESNINSKPGYLSSLMPAQMI